MNRVTRVAPAVVAALLCGCQSSTKPDYGRALPPGASALRKLPPEQWPGFGAAYEAADDELIAAIHRSVDWYRKPSTQQFFPIDGITHEQARLSAWAVGRTLERAASADAFTSALRAEFDVYTSVGWDHRGTVLFTGYYSPVFTASREPTGEYGYPLYRRPPDLAIDPLTGRVLGRTVGATHVRYPARAEIERDPDTLGLSGLELVYLRDRLEVFLIHVNGSARLAMTDGSTMYIGYGGSNGHEYTSVGKLLVRDGRIPRDQLSLPTLRDFFREHPDRLDHYTNQNRRFIFFEEYNGDDWPAGSLGFKVTPWRTVATDKRIFPRGLVVLVRTQIPDPHTVSSAHPGSRAFSQLMVDQDTGGAIRAAGRADLYMGVGADAEAVAGRQAAEGRLYYLILKPQRVEHWRRQRGQIVRSPRGAAPGV